MISKLKKKTISHVMLENVLAPQLLLEVVDFNIFSIK